MVVPLPLQTGSRWRGQGTRDLASHIRALDGTLGVSRALRGSTADTTTDDECVCVGGSLRLRSASELRTWS